MPKSEVFYPKGYITKVLNSISESTLITMKACVKAGCQIDYLIERFYLSKSEATIVYLTYKPEDTDPLAQVGSKQESYYEDEDPVIPVYKVEDLNGDEKRIANNDTTTKLWTWEE